jgi:hypothetical protein
VYLAALMSGNGHSNTHDKSSRGFWRNVWNNNMNNCYLCRLLNKIARRIVSVSALRIIGNDVLLPFAVNDPGTFHKDEWLSVYSSLNRKGSRSIALYFALTRPVDALAIRRRFGGIRRNGKLVPRQDLR